MPKKSMSAEEKKAWGEKMKRAREAKKQQEQLKNNPQPSTDNADYQELLNRIKELESYLPRGTAQVGSQGLVGTYERFKTDKAYYPDPRERLAKETRLERFAFAENYELGWEVGLSQYKTIDGVNTREPKFTLKLIVKVYDEDTGELTNKRFVILNGIFHEDPDAAIQIASENGVIIDESNERAFLDEMRYLRFRDWLLEAFYPTPPPAPENKKQIVIGNKLVEIYEVTSDKPESMAKGLSQLEKKL